MTRRPPRSTLSSSSAASDVYKRQVKEVLEYIRTHGRDSETLNVIYVVDEKGRLIDDVRIRQFLLAPLDAHVRDIRDKSFVALKVTDSETDAVDLVKKYDRN